MNGDLYLTVQQVADRTGMTRQGVHCHIKRGDFGQPFRGSTPPGKTLETGVVPGRPARIWLKRDDIVEYYKTANIIYRRSSGALTICD